MQVILHAPFLEIVRFRSYFPPHFWRSYDSGRIAALVQRDRTITQILPAPFLEIVRSIKYCPPHFSRSCDYGRIIIPISRDRTIGQILLRPITLRYFEFVIIPSNNRINDDYVSIFETDNQTYFYSFHGSCSYNEMVSETGRW